MQVRAILSAMMECKKDGINVFPEIMISLVSTAQELKVILSTMEKTAREVFHGMKNSIDNQFGTMMEVRANAYSIVRMNRM